MLTVLSHTAELLNQVHGLIERARGGSSPEDLYLRKESTVKELDSIQSVIGPCPPLENTSRHIHWLLYWHSKGNHEKYQGDIVDLLGADLPGVTQEVEAWVDSRMDPRLIASIQTSWSSQNYPGAVREAFICLEAEIRRAAGINEEQGLSGDRLITKAFQSSNFSDAISDSGPLGKLTTGEVKGFEHLARGAFLLFRNATAHRNVTLSEVEADQIIGIANQCIKLIPRS